MNNEQKTDYNGWTNYATWRINLEIFDGRDWSDEQTDPQESISAFSDYLKDLTDDCVTNFGELEGLAVDYARAFISEVNYYEIAQHIAENYPAIIKAA